MPHDIKGKPLTPGAIVLLACIIEAIQPTEDACNVTLNVLGPKEEYLPQIACNAKLSLLVVESEAQEKIAGDLNVEDVIGVVAGRTIDAYIEAQKPAQSIPATPAEVLPEVAQSKAWRKGIDLLQTKFVELGGFPRGEVLNLASEIEQSSQKSEPLAICVERLRHACGAPTDRLKRVYLSEATMWLGVNLEIIDEANPGSAPNPYPNSKDPSSPVIEKTADGLKFAGIEPLPSLTAGDKPGDVEVGAGTPA